jgi:hypothetical protein
MRTLDWKLSKLTLTFSYIIRVTISSELFMYSAYLADLSSEMTLVHPLVPSFSTTSFLPSEPYGCSQQHFILCPWLHKTTAITHSPHLIRDIALTAQEFSACHLKWLGRDSLVSPEVYTTETASILNAPSRHLEAFSSWPAFPAASSPVQYGLKPPPLSRLLLHTSSPVQYGLKPRSLSCLHLYLQSYSSNS